MPAKDKSKYTASENDVNPTLSDFASFCTYLEEKQPKLTKVRGELGKKDCYAINALLAKPHELDGPKYLQYVYPTINLFFHIALTTGLFAPQSDGKGGVRLQPSPRLERYKALNPFAKYMFLFRTYWTKLNYNELYADSMTMLHHFMATKLAFTVLRDAEPRVRIFANVEDFRNGYDRNDPVHRLMVGAGLVVRHLQDLGFWEGEEAHIPDFHLSKKDLDYKAITPTALGLAMIDACLQRPYEVYNEAADPEYVAYRWDDSYYKALIEQLGVQRPPEKMKKEPFERVFQPIFPSGTIDSGVMDAMFDSGDKPAPEGVSGNAYIFKVLLNRGIWRRIKLAAYHNLHHLHEAIQDAFEFYDDHLYAFFMDGRPWSSNAYWSQDSGDQPVASQGVLGRLGLVRGQKFLYLFDFGEEWKFQVQVEEILQTDVAPIRPVVIERKGVAPEQYA